MNGKLRVGFFAGPSLTIGGSRGVTLPLAKALQRLGHQSVALEIGYGPSRYVRREDGIPVWRQSLLPHLTLRPPSLAQTALHRLRNSRGGSHLAPPTEYDLALGRAQLAAARRLRLDVLYTFHNTNALGVAWQGVPADLVFIVNLIGFGIDQSRGGSTNTFVHQAALFERLNWDLHITATRFEYEQYTEVYQALDLPVERLVHLPHPYDTSRFHLLTSAERGALRRKYGLPESELVLLYPVNVYPRKNVEMAVTVTALLNDSTRATLLVSGAVWDETYHRRLLTLARSHSIGDRVRFLGGIADAQMIEVYNLADVTVFPSHQETFGLGLVESLGCGTPVVGPDWINPCKETLDGVPGGVVAAKDDQAFARAVINCASDTIPRHEIAAAARERFGNEVVAGRFLSCLERVRAAKLARLSRLRSIDWKSLYRDEVSLPTASLRRHSR